MINTAESEKARVAMELFKQGYNCSQAVVGAWADEIGVDFETAVKFSAGFGGGMGRLREVCGSVSGAFMVLGMKYSTGRPDPQSKKAMYEKIQSFAARFKEENKFNSIICREMLGLNGSSKPIPAERTEEYYRKRPCPELIAMSAALLEEFM
ncbi:MAG: C-GCAxxG-C-C family protein [bacterium]|nr:C-GCAxxG-C-C family protein [bacterium]